MVEKEKRKELHCAFCGRRVVTKSSYRVHLRWCKPYQEKKARGEVPAHPVSKKLQRRFEKAQMKLDIFRDS